MPQERGQMSGSNPESEEVRLLARIAAGDRLAFETLYRTYFSRLSRFVGRMARNAALIEEVVNDTMLVVWQKAATFDGSCKVSTWIFAIAYRKTLKGLKASDDPVESDASLYEDDSGNQPEQTMNRQQLQQTVGEALDQLPAAQRAVMVLTYYHDMAYSDIAEVVDCPLNTVKTRMFHARHRLKDLLWNERESSR
ncbi:RNA polymerase sigma factor [Rugamonas rivuli]|uniref:Sigma-70 family RNA polymerase sigma factor n=1 Tax=Rugamonas rivuli TaxID=2743358 RepID=A0A843S1Q4_9BURK|nr:sigma-70 family RNA polymerase sigma factor [Rugamonas rivuli]